MNDNQAFDLIELALRGEADGTEAVDALMELKTRFSMKRPLFDELKGKSLSEHAKAKLMAKGKKRPRLKPARAFADPKWLKVAINGVTNTQEADAVTVVRAVPGPRGRKAEIMFVFLKDDLRTFVWVDGVCCGSRIDEYKELGDSLVDR